MKSKRIKGFLYLTAAAFILASFGVLVRLLADDMTTYQQIYLRNGIAFIFALIAVKLARQKPSTLKKIPIKMLPLALAFPLSVVFFTFSVQHTKVATTIFTLYAASLVSSVILGRLFFGERLKGYRLAAFMAAFVGVLVYVLPLSSGFIGFGFILGLLSGFADGLANLYRKLIGGKVDKFATVTLNMAIGLVLTFTLSIITGETLSSLADLPLQAWGMLVLFGFLLVFMYLFTLKGFENFDLNIGTIVLSSELIFGSVFAFVLFQEAPRIPEVIGMAIIFLAQYFLIRAEEAS